MQKMPYSTAAIDAWHASWLVGQVGRLIMSDNHDHCSLLRIKLHLLFHPAAVLMNFRR